MSLSQLTFLPYLEHETADRPANFIPIYEPWLGETEEAYVLDAVRSGWISSLGQYISRFEREFAEYCGAEHGVSVSNGTAALHLALHALGIGPGDEVIVPALSFVASANAVYYTGARPIFVDVDSHTWTLDPERIEQHITPRTRAIMPVHLYGHPAPMHELIELAARYELQIVEDAAEAHGAQVNGHRVGALGRIGAFSFYGNKIITTGEGGMLVTNDSALADRCRMLRDHAMPPERRYWHEEVGFNYRMTNLQAAVGVAQLERIDQFLACKRAIAKRYDAALRDVPGLVLPYERPGYTNVYWMYSILVQTPFPLTRDELIQALRARGIDSRPFFHPLDTLPFYAGEPARPTAKMLSECGLNLPSFPRLSDGQLDYICTTLRELANAS
ncbi:MAG: DegT/DnrJ/EryC1/StrS family aminotransferase [Litorilinea sp.]